MPSVSRACDTCGAVFQSMQSTARRFCSHPCYAKSLVGKLKPKPLHTCERCGQQFRPRHSKPNRFCSLPCQRGKLDLTGQRFGRLVVLSEAPRAKCGQPRWLCLCDCGKETIVQQTSLRGKMTMSCGCIWLATISGPKLERRTNPSRHTPEFLCWQGMVRRCTEPQAPNFHLYGGRGIQVCDRWRNSLAAFMEDMGPRPSMEHTLDRLDPNGNYEVGNVRWGSSEEQHSNRRNNRYLEFEGETLTVSQWARRLGFDPGTLFGRLRKGWSIEDTLTIPPRQTKKAT